MSRQTVHRLRHTLFASLALTMTLGILQLTWAGQGGSSGGGDCLCDEENRHPTDTDEGVLWGAITADFSVRDRSGYDYVIDYLSTHDLNSASVSVYVPYRPNDDPTGFDIVFFVTDVWDKDYCDSGEYWSSVAISWDSSGVPAIYNPRVPTTGDYSGLLQIDVPTGISAADRTLTAVATLSDYGECHTGADDQDKTITYTVTFVNLEGPEFVTDRADVAVVPMPSGTWVDRHIWTFDRFGDSPFTTQSPIFDEWGDFDDIADLLGRDRWTHGTVTVRAERDSRGAANSTNHYDIDEQHSLKLLEILFTDPATQEGVIVPTGSQLNWTARVFPDLDPAEYTLSSWLFTMVEGECAPMASSGVPGSHWQERVCDMCVISGDEETIRVQASVDVEHTGAASGSGMTAATTGGSSLAQSQEATAEMPPLSVSVGWDSLQPITYYLYPPDHTLDPNFEKVQSFVVADVKYASACGEIVLTAGGGYPSSPWFIYHFSYNESTLPSDWDVTSVPHTGNPMTIVPCPREDGSFTVNVEIRFQWLGFDMPVQTMPVTLNMAEVECEWVCGNFAVNITSNSFFWSDCHYFSYTQGSSPILGNHSIRETIDFSTTLEVIPASGEPHQYPSWGEDDHSPPSTPIQSPTNPCGLTIRGWRDCWALNATPEVHQTKIFDGMQPGDLPAEIVWTATFDDQFVFLDEGSSCELEFGSWSGAMTATYIVSGELGAVYNVVDSLQVEAITPTGTFNYP